MSIANWFRGDDNNPFPRGVDVYGDKVETDLMVLRSVSGELLNMRATEFQSPWLNASLPSISISGQDHPFSIVRQSVFVNDISFSIPNNTTQIISLGDAKINQMNLSFPSPTIVQASEEIANTFVELYVNLKVNASNNTNIQVDISGIDSSFFEVIDSRSVNKAGVYNINFSSHIVPPDAFVGGNQYHFIIDNFGNQPITIQKITTSIKSIVL